MIDTNEQRSWPLRIVYGLLWALGFYFVPRMLIGAIVGAIAGSKVTFEAGYASGYMASFEFFREFGSIILMMQVSIFAVLCYFALLPGVGKYKSRKETSSPTPPPPEIYGLASQPENVTKTETESPGNEP